MSIARFARLVVLLAPIDCHQVVVYFIYRCKLALLLFGMFFSNRSSRSILLMVAPVLVLAAGIVKYSTIGKQADGSILLPTGQLARPAGTHINVNDRPLGMALSPDGKTLAVVTGSNFNPRALHLIDTATKKSTQTLTLKDGFNGVAFNKAGDTIYVGGNGNNDIPVIKRGADGKFAASTPIAMPAGSAPSGVSISPNEQSIYVALNLTHTLCIADVKTGALTQVPVGRYPYMTVPTPDGKRVYVSNWGGRVPKADDMTDGLNPVVVDPRTGIAASGSVSVVDVATQKVVKEIPVGLHPSSMVLNGNAGLLYVANANSDTVSIIDISTDTVVADLKVGIRANAPLGSAPNALALSADGMTLYVADGGNNAIAVIDPSNPDHPLKGFIPTGWYPTAVTVAANGKQLYVANGYGFGSIDPPAAAAGAVTDPTYTAPTGTGRSYQYRYGIVSIIDTPDAAALAKYSAVVRKNNKSLPPSPVARPVDDGSAQPIPVYPGQTSPIKHVFLIIKENRTYDQVFGDLPKGNGDSSLAIFDRNVTPNHHALAEQFGLMDNYYGPGDQSALGHRWITQGFPSDWAMKYSNARNDQNPMLFAPTDFIWDAMKRHGKTVRSFGERGLNTITPATATWSDIYSDYVNNTSKVTVAPRAVIVGLRDVYSSNVAAAESKVPDVVRAKGFLKEFADFDKNGNLPDLCVLLLYNDHTAGTSPGYPTPRAQVADNDLAVGQVVDAISHSRYWKESAIFITEDDSQDGTDHVDGHRTVGLVISPYTKHNNVDSSFYTIINMFRTMEQILGLPPMNQYDMAAEPMFSLFTTSPDLTPYTAIKNNIALDEMNPSLAKLKGLQRQYALASSKMDFSEPDANPADLLNRIIWHSVKGYSTPYPADKSRRK